MFNKETNVSSDKQSGGITAGNIQNKKNINFNIWKERGKGAVIIILLEFFIYLIKLLLKF